MLTHQPIVRGEGNTHRHHHLHHRRCSGESANYFVCPTVENDGRVSQSVKSRIFDRHPVRLVYLRWSQCDLSVWCDRGRPYSVPRSSPRSTVRGLDGLIYDDIRATRYNQLVVYIRSRNISSSCWSMFVGWSVVWLCTCINTDVRCVRTLPVYLYTCISS